MGNSIMLAIYKQNAYDDKSYIEYSNGTIDTTDLSPNDFWTIINPSSACVQTLQQRIPKCNIRKYADCTFLMSPKAYDKIPPYKTGNGSACVISFMYNDIKWYLMVSDNKPYIQNCGGMGKPHETPKDTMIRELEEELQLHITPDRINYLGQWSYMYSNDLISIGWEMKTTLFELKLRLTDLYHLGIPTSEKLLTEEIFTIPITASQSPTSQQKSPTSTSTSTSPTSTTPPPKLDEVEYIYVIPETKLLDAPREINGKKFDNHHRACLHYISNIDCDIDTSYLYSFVML